MGKRTLGKSGIKVSAMGLGCWAIGGLSWRDGKPSGWAGSNDDESIRAIHKALDMGVNFLDTAAGYGCGHSERVIAKAIAGKRANVTIATKFGFPMDEEKRTLHGERWDREFIYEQCEGSLRRLNTDYIDIYQLHLGKCEQGALVRDVLEELVKEGKVRWYGASTTWPELARTFAAGKHCTAIQMRLNVLDRNDETLQVCEDNNLASINRSPLSTGLLSGKYDSDSTFPAEDVRTSWDMRNGGEAEKLKKLQAMREILQSDGRTLVQGALCWIWAHSKVTVPIPGFKSVEQVEENAGALAFDPLTADQMTEIDRILHII